MKRQSIIVIGIILAFGHFAGSCAPVPSVKVKPAPTTPGAVFRNCPECPEMVVIPAGSFMMGSPATESERYDYEGPQHRVAISRPFAIGKYEVTFAEWNACVRAGGCSHRPDYMRWDRGDHPVIYVTWDDANEYVRWLSRKTGHEYRLPSEAEWEYAARAGTTTARYWGSDPDRACSYGNVYDLTSKHEKDYAWSHHDCQDGYAEWAPVGKFSPNRFGLHDVLGNVWEWVADCWNDNYFEAPSDGSAWTREDCSDRVMRGGSWSKLPRIVRSANREWGGAGLRYLIVGFRVARTLP